MIKFIELKKQLKSSLNAMYVLTGNDAFFLDSAVKEIANATNMANPSLNLCYFKNESYQEFLDSLISLPFMDDKRVSVIHSLDFTNKEVLKQLNAYLTSPNPQNCSIIVSPIKFTKLVGDVELVNCDKENKSVLAKWIRARLATFDKTISEEDAIFIAERCELNMQLISSECEKYIAYCNDKREVTRDDIELLLAKPLESIVFELTDAIIKKDIIKARKIYEDLKFQKLSDDMGVLALLYGNFKRMFYARILDVSDIDLANLLKVKPYSVVVARRNASKYSKVSLQHIVRKLSTYDFMIKSGACYSENLSLNLIDYLILQ